MIAQIPGRVCLSATYTAAEELSLNEKRQRGMEDWRNEVKDPEERLVFDALDDPTWDFRTVEGIASTKNLSEDFVRGVLVRHEKLVREALLPDARGRRMFRLRERGPAPYENLAEARAFFTKTRL